MPPITVGHFQTTFVLDCLITDNNLIVFGNFHYMTRENIGKSCWKGLKPNLPNTYDKVEWSFSA